MRTITYVFLGVGLLVGGVTLGFIGGLLFLLFVTYARLPWIVPMHEYAAVITLAFLVIIAMLAILKRSKTLLLSIFVAPGFYVFLITPYEVAIWLTS